MTSDPDPHARHGVGAPAVAGVSSRLAAAVAAARDAVAELAELASSGAARGEVDGDALAALVADVHAVGRMVDAAGLALVGDLDARGWAGVSGAGTTAAFLRSTLLVTPRAAAATVRLARALQRGHAATRAALAGAEVGVEHARVLTDTLDALPATVDAATRAEAETALAGAARVLDPAQLAVLGRHLSALLDPAGLTGSLERAHAARRLTLSTTLDGVLHINGHTDAVTGATLLTALDPLAAPAPAADGTTDPRTPDQRRADALITLAQLALDHPAGRAGDPAGGPANPEGTGAAGAEPGAAPAPHPANPSPEALPPARTALGRPHLLLTVDVTALTGAPAGPGAPASAIRAVAEAAYGRPLPPAPPCEQPPPGEPPPPGEQPAAGEPPPGMPPPVGTLTWAGPLPPADARRLACDAAVTAVITAGRRVLDVGRTRRYVTPDLLRALIVRDGGGCAFPTCTRPWTWCHAHHIRHWSDGGPTSLDNLVLLCSAHHRLVHSTTGAADWVIEPPAVSGHPPPSPAARCPTGRPGARRRPHPSRPAATRRTQDRTHHATGARREAICRPGPSRAASG